MTNRKTRPPKALPRAEKQVLRPAFPDEETGPATQPPHDLIVDLPPDLEFDPVPRLERPGSLHAKRQRHFIALLLACGTVRGACRALGCSTDAIYNLRNSAGAKSFSAAWDKAVARGAQRVLDTMMDHNINGIPETIYGPDGQKVAERRRFNTRAQMWVVAHYFPERFGVTGGLMNSASGPIGLKRLKTAWRKEWEEEFIAKYQAYRKANGTEEEKQARFVKEGLRLYELKVGEERRLRTEGKIVAADHALRQLTHIELLLESAGAGKALIEKTGSRGFGQFKDDRRHESDLTRQLDAARRKAWAEAGEDGKDGGAMMRPPTQIYPNGAPSSALWGGPTWDTREKALKEAQAMAARAQALWEATANEESWERWKGEGFLCGEPDDEGKDEALKIECVNPT